MPTYNPFWKNPIHTSEQNQNKITKSTRSQIKKKQKQKEIT